MRIYNAVIWEYLMNDYIYIKFLLHQYLLPLGFFLSWCSLGHQMLWDTSIQMLRDTSIHLVLLCVCLSVWTRLSSVGRKLEKDECSPITPVTEVTTRSWYPAPPPETVTPSWWALPLPSTECHPHHRPPIRGYQNLKGQGYQTLTQWPLSCPARPPPHWPPTSLCTPWSWPAWCLAYPPSGYLVTFLSWSTQVNTVLNFKGTWYCEQFLYNIDYILWYSSWLIW